MSTRTVRLGGAAAIVFVVLILVTVASAQPPGAGDSAEKIRTFLADHRAAVLAGAIIQLLAVPFLIWFGVVLRDVLHGDQTDHALGTAALAGLLMSVPMALAGQAVLASAVYVDGVAGQLGDDAVRILFETQNLLFASTSAGVVLFLVTVAFAVRRTGVLPGYTMWVALVAAIANVVTMFSVLGAGASAVGIIGLIGFLVFLLVAGGTMAAGKARGFPNPA